MLLRPMLRSSCRYYSAARTASNLAPQWPAVSVANQQPSPDERNALTAALSHKLSEESARAVDGSAVRQVGVAWVTGSEQSGGVSQIIHEQTKEQLRPLQCGVGLAQACDELVDAQRSGTQDSNGGYLAYAPTGAVFGSALASFASASVNPGLTWLPTSPGAAAIEASGIEFMTEEMLGWSCDAGGVFTSGGSAANTLALHTGRVAAAAATPGASETDVTYYAPVHCHYSIFKGLRVLGVPPSHIVLAASNSADGSIDVPGLAAQLEEAGPGPVVLVGVGGATSTGTIDDLEACVLAQASPFCDPDCAVRSVCNCCCRLGKLRDQRNSRLANGHCWIHADACFGGFFLLTQRGRASKLSGLACCKPLPYIIRFRWLRGAQTIDACACR